MIVEFMMINCVAWTKPYSKAMEIHIDVYRCQSTIPSMLSLIKIQIGSVNPRDKHKNTDRNI